MGESTVVDAPNEPIFDLRGVGEHSEHVFSGVVVGNVLVSHIYVGLSGRRSRRVDVMDGTLGHFSEDLEELGVLDFASVLEEVSSDNILSAVRFDELILQLLELLVAQLLLGIESNAG